VGEAVQAPLEADSAEDPVALPHEASGSGDSTLPAAAEADEELTVGIPSISEILRDGMEPEPMSDTEAHVGGELFHRNMDRLVGLKGAPETYTTMEGDGVSHTLELDIDAEGRPLRAEIRRLEVIGGARDDVVSFRERNEVDGSIGPETCFYSSNTATPAVYRYDTPSDDPDEDIRAEAKFGERADLGEIVRLDMLLRRGTPIARDPQRPADAD
jgi:hypothetical protein